MVLKSFDAFMEARGGTEERHRFSLYESRLAVRQCDKIPALGQGKRSSDHLAAQGMIATLTLFPGPQFLMALEQSCGPTRRSDPGPTRPIPNTAVNQTQSCQW